LHATPAHKTTEDCMGNMLCLVDAGMRIGRDQRLSKWFSSKVIAKSRAPGGPACPPCLVDDGTRSIGYQGTLLTRWTGWDQKRNL